MKPNLFLLIATLLSARAVESPKPNVLLIISDDLRCWLGSYGDPYARTPNLDRLAARGTVFRQAVCAAPLCNPSRTSLITGMSPSQTGVYGNDVPWSKAVPDAMTLPLLFKKNGYYVSGAGKITHASTVRPSDWHDFGPVGQGALKGKNRQTVDKWKWMVVDNDEEKNLPDYLVTSYVVERLQQPQSKPFFLACGIHRPHTSWDVPRKYFDLHPLAEIKQPPIKETDLDDVPPIGRQFSARNSDESLRAIPGGPERVIQAYRAAVSFMDAQVGRLLEALDASPARDNTIIVFCGDNGWHLGEKQHLTKITLWKEAVEVPLMWVVPGVTQAGTTCKHPVDFTSIFPTLCDLTGLTTPAQSKGASLRPLLADPKAPWTRPAISTMGRGNHSLSDERYRYIRYSDGTDELYDHSNDPNEWTNIAKNPESASVIARFAPYLPTTEVNDKGDLADRKGYSKKDSNSGE